MDESIDLFLRMGLLLSLLLFLIVFNITPADDCDACDFTLNEKKLDARELIDKYFHICIDPYTGEFPRYIEDIILIDEVME